MAEIDILREMNSGFSALHLKIDKRFEAVQGAFQEHLLPCQERFAEIEKDQAIREAENGVKKEARKLWLYIIRFCILTIAGGALALVWNLITGNVHLVAR